MTDLTKKELVSQLYDTFADRVAVLDKELKEKHQYLNATQQHQNLVTDIGNEVYKAGWLASAAVIDALCHGGAELMALDLEAETIVPPPELVNESGLRTDGPTLEQFVAAGYPATAYPPQGYAVRESPPLVDADPPVGTAVDTQEGAGDQSADGVDQRTQNEQASQGAPVAAQGADASDAETGALAGTSTVQAEGQPQN